MVALVFSLARAAKVASDGITGDGMAAGAAAAGPGMARVGGWPTAGARGAGGDRREPR